MQHRITFTHKKTNHMKKFLLSIVAALLAVPSFAQMSSGGFSVSESNLYYGVRLGMNISSFTGKGIKDIDSKVGMTLGGVIGMRVSESTPVFLESGLYYASRGAKDFNVNYLELPILIKYGIQVSDNVSVLPFIGPYFSLGVSGKHKYDDGTGNKVKDSSFDAVKRSDMGFKLGCGIEYNMLYAEVGYQFGVQDIAKDNPSDDAAHTSNLFINVGVNF